MPDILPDPCGKKNPGPEYRIYVPGSPTKHLQTTPQQGGNVVRLDGGPRWFSQNLVLSNRWVCGGFSYGTWMQHNPAEIRRGATALIKYEMPIGMPPEGGVLIETPWLQGALYTMWNGTLINPPLTLPDPQVVFYLTPSTMTFEWTVHSDEMQAVLFTFRGKWVWMVGEDPVERDYGYLTIDF